MGRILNKQETTEMVKLTEDVLNCISKHLSSRKECRGKVYRVAIGVKDEQQRCSVTWPFPHPYSIFFETDVELYSHTSKTDRRKHPAIQHIITEHFPEVYGGTCNGNQAQIKIGKLFHGIYEYRLSSTGKYRRWFAII